MPNHGLEIVVRPDLAAIVARWHREISAVELQIGYEAILAAADAAQCGRWLLDLRRRNELATPEIDTWMNTEFLPQLLGRYTQSSRLAFLVSPMRAARSQPTCAVTSDANPVPGIESAVFTNEADAYQWLAQ